MKTARAQMLCEHAKYECVCVCTRACVLSDVGLINDVCVAGLWFYAYRDVVGNGPKPFCSPPFSSFLKPKREERDGW